MADNTTLHLNGEDIPVSSSNDTPLLYVLSDELGLQGPRFGCGLGQCGSCSVLVNGVEMRSCVTPLAAVSGMSVTTLEGLHRFYAAAHNLASTPELTPVQQAMIDEQAIQCGYCYNGMIIKATELLEQNPDPDIESIRRHMNGHLCRCGTYPQIIRAIQRASILMKTHGGAA